MGGGGELRRGRVWSPRGEKGRVVAERWEGAGGGLGFVLEMWIFREVRLGERRRDRWVEGG